MVASAVECLRERACCLKPLCFGGVHAQQPVMQNVARRGRGAEKQSSDLGLCSCFCPCVPGRTWPPQQPTGRSNDSEGLSQPREALTFWTSPRERAVVQSVRFAAALRGPSWVPPAFSQSLRNPLLMTPAVQEARTVSGLRWFACVIPLN